MSDNAKTLTFGGIALVVALTAFLMTRPTELPPDAQGASGQALYPAFTDPLSAGSLEIMTYDRATATPRDFKVALVNGRWVIPSHENYPTDAKQQLAGAAASVMDLKILEVKSDAAADHEQYGVLDPDPAKNEIKAGSEGVGTKVVLDDKAGKDIMRLIIGKEDPSQPGVYFVRRAGQDRVYTTKLDTSKLSTQFEDWIEPDLLKVSGFDIDSVFIDNYSINETARSREDLIQQQEELSLTYSDAAEAGKKWQLAGLQPGEELNEEPLNAMRDALDDLRIVDVRRKPAGLTAELKTQEGMTLDEEAYNSLRARGFYVIDGALRPNEGEAIVGTKDGIEYVLRFGEIAGDTGATSAAGDGKDADEKGQNRYIFITAQFNPDRIEKPQLQPLPGEEPATEAPTTEEPAETGEAADDATDDAAAAEPAKGEATTDTEAAPANACQAPAEDEAADAEPAAEAAPAADAATQSPDQVMQDALRQQIQAENKRAQELYDQKVKEGQDKAKELNERFADWYYVISDDMFKKIKLRRADIIKGSAETSVEQFEQLRDALPPAPQDGEADAATEEAGTTQQ